MRIATDHRESILQSAARLFARKPYHEVLMDDVAEQTGIAKGTIYRFFPNKEELFATLHLQFVDKMTREVERVGRGSNPIKNLNERLARAELIAENSDFFQVMLRHECEVWELKSSEVLEQRNILRDLYAEQIESAESLGLVKCKYGSKTAADMLLGMMRNILRFTRPVPEPAQIGEMMLDMFVHGVGARGAAGEPRKNGKSQKNSKLAVEDAMAKSNGGRNLAAPARSGV